MADAAFAVYHNRAMQLANAMRLCQDDLHAYGAAAALLAVHSAISYGDAVLIGLGFSRSRGDNHQQAVNSLKRACTKAKIKSEGIAHFQKLIGAKTDISYGDRQVDNDRTTALCIAAERFQVWAERTLQGREEGYGYVG